MHIPAGYCCHVTSIEELLPKLQSELALSQASVPAWIVFSVTPCKSCRSSYCHQPPNKRKLRHKSGALSPGSHIELPGMSCGLGLHSYRNQGTTVLASCQLRFEA